MTSCFPAKAGTQAAAKQRFPLPWTPAFAGERKSPNFVEADLTQFDSIVVTPGLPLNRHPIAKRAADAGVEIIGDIELFARARPELPPHKVVGITGTNGKSTTTALIHHILKTAGVPATMGGNIGLPILAQDPLPEGGVYVLELSSYQIDLTQSLDCDVAVLLNITPDHLDRYESFEAYAASKARLFEMQTPEHARHRRVLAQTVVRTGSQSTRRWLKIPCIRLIDDVDVDRSSRHGRRCKARITLKMRRPPLPSARHWPWQTGSISSGPSHLSRPPAPDGARARKGRRPVRQRQQGDQSDGGGAGAGGLPEDPLDPRRAGQDRQSRRMRPALRPCRQGLYHWRGGSKCSRRLLSPHMDVAECETLDECGQDVPRRMHKRAIRCLLSPACASFDQFRDFEARGRCGSGNWWRGYEPDDHRQDQGQRGTGRSQPLRPVRPVGRWAAGSGKSTASCCSCWRC